MRTSKQNKISLTLPNWASVIYICLALVLVPWTIYLAATLPTYHLSSHWDISWVGLDIGITISLLLTGILAKMQSQLVVLSASATASFLIVDAWFDIISSRNGLELNEATVLAIFIELPLALISFLLAYKALISTRKANHRP